MANLETLLYIGVFISRAYSTIVREELPGYRLHRDLFAGYNKNVRPIKSYNDTATEVEMSFNLQAIVNIDERQQMMTTNGILHMMWIDPVLTWDASDYENIQTMIVSQDDMWLPDINVLNTVTPSERLGYETGPVLVENKSVVTWQPHCVFQTACQIDITYFPFDIQNCTLMLGTRQTTLQEVRIVPGDEPIFYYQFSPNSQWQLIRTDIQFTGEIDYLSNVKITFVIRRRPAKIVCTILVPVVFLSVTAVLVFLLPIDGGDRVGTTVTILLSYAVYLTLVADSLPMNAKTISCLEMYLLFLIFVATLIAMSNVFLTDMSVREGSIGVRVAKHLKRLQSCLYLEPCMKRKRQGHRKVQDSSEMDDLNRKELDEFIPPTPDAPTDTAMTWDEATKTLDRMFFLTFTFATCVGSAIFYGILIAGPHLPDNNIKHSDNPSAAL